MEPTPVPLEKLSRGLITRRAYLKRLAALEAAIADGLASGRPTLIRVPIRGGAPKGGDAI